MDFFATILFLIVFYLRPQDWVEIVAGMHLVQLIMAFGLLSILVNHRGITLRDILQTPQDWMMLAYVSWIVYLGNGVEDTNSQMATYFLTYVILVLALSDFERIRRFLTWWTGMIIVLAALALLAEIGIDPTHSYDLTHGRFMGRLAFNTSMTHNPNSLAHSVVPAVTLGYFLWYWRRRIFVKEVAIPVLAIPVLCVYGTQSKGAYLSGFVTIVAALLFGRPKLVQVGILVLAATLGWAGMQHLPRMAGMNDLERDEGVLGRKAAFQFGLSKLESGERVGWRKFQDAFEATHGYAKASHSSYNEVATELGYPGLFLFLGIMYCCLRTVVAANTIDDEEERVRRMIFVLVVSFAVSSWMIDFATRSYFFMFAAVASAFHRHLLRRPAVAPEVSQPAVAALPAPPAVAALPAPATASGNVQTPPPTPPAAVPEARPRRRPRDKSKSEPEPTPAPEGIGLRWRRLGWMDLAIVYGLTYVTVRFWHYVLEKV